MWCRRGGLGGGNKIRKPEQSPMSREYKDRKKRLVASISPPPSATRPVFKTEELMASLPPQTLQSDYDFEHNSSIPPPTATEPVFKTEEVMTSLPPLPMVVSTPPPPEMADPSSRLREISPAESKSAAVSPEAAHESIASTWVGSFEQGVAHIKMLLVKCKNQRRKAVPEDLTSRIEIVKSFLRYLEFEVEMTPKIKETYQLHQVLRLVEQEDFRDVAPADIAATCLRLLAMYEEENWGEDQTEAQQPQTAMGEDYLEAQAASGSEPSTRRRSTPASAPATANMTLPPPDHPIWGLNGIMHCLALSPSTRRNYVIDPRYAHKKRNAKVFGHNGLEPGIWWPYQKLAHFHGAHGAPIQGITGDPTLGAYSIVTSGSSGYDAMDQDFGDTLFYSADNSHDNTDPNNIAYTSNRTRSLHTSLSSGRPVRVLRSSGGKKAYTPRAGIRYDGLYRVVAVRQVLNKKGGLYEQFELRRLPNQRSLDDIQRSVPSRQQEKDFAKIKNGY
ncbi:PUA-like domain containing protein [Naviculisporaceae sp. PSN 640]